MNQEEYDALMNYIDERILDLTSRELPRIEISPQAAEWKDALFEYLQ